MADDTVNRRRDSVDMSDIVFPSRQESGGGMKSAAVFAYFILYSMAMFTLPFLAFVGTKYSLKHYFLIEGFANTVWSVVSAVVTVNVIILMYACKGYREEEEEEKRKENHPKED